ncbi:hypothetical protein ABZ342_43960, partial [Amycolatopsis sp. NPDC005961]|uniref:hypothetical protein n=1 Tax=Amycolatopsis sp. NPDC005961 TaxID=3156720 RepID=UPI0033D697BF
RVDAVVLESGQDKVTVKAQYVLDATETAGSGPPPPRRRSAGTGGFPPRCRPVRRPGVRGLIRALDPDRARLYRERLRGAQPRPRGDCCARARWPKATRVAVASKAFRS